MKKTVFIKSFYKDENKYKDNFVFVVLEPVANDFTGLTSIERRRYLVNFHGKLSDYVSHNCEITVETSPVLGINVCTAAVVLDAAPEQPKKKKSSTKAKKPSEKVSTSNSLVELF